MKRFLTRRSLVAVLLLVAFQNCSPPFQAREPGFREHASGGADEAGSVLDPGGGGLEESITAEKTVVSDELRVLRLRVRAQDDDPLDPSGLPPGAKFDATTGLLLWLPKHGQAGTHDLEFRDSIGFVRLRLRLKIEPAPASILEGGPTDGAAHGDVGFVFIHGMGPVDRCADQAELAAYWESTPTVIGRNGPVKVACYDARVAAEAAAIAVAQQIVDADCGALDRCILVAHSMGGLVAEFILTHDREARDEDPEPALFEKAELFARAKERVLSVIAIGSAAGGSRVADALASQNSNSVSSWVGHAARVIGQGTEASKSVTTVRATQVLSPVTADPGVPIYLVPAYSVQTSWEWDPWFGGFLGGIIGSVPMKVFQGDRYLAALDAIVLPNSRGDGLVEFRGACGVSSADPHAGPGYSAPLSAQLDYCAKSPKRPNRHLWFLSNINHMWVQTPWSNCGNSDNPCHTLEYIPSTRSLVRHQALDGKSAVHVIREKIDANRRPALARKLLIGNGSVTDTPE